MDDPDAAEFTAYEQNMQLVTIDQGAVLQTRQAGQMVVLPATSTGLALTCGSDLSLVHVATPSFRFKQLDTDTDLNTAPSALQRQAHLESLMKTSRKQQQQMSLRLHGGHVELAGCGDEYGYEDFEALPPSFETSSRSHASSSSSSTPTHDDMVHFLGPAENIKTLFKLPYSNSRVSLAIHRVGNTLIVDGEVDETDLPRGFDACNEVLKPDQPSQRTNKDHPAVSLKLHDVNDELSLCTALDYYLDNVIANIPELAICMHSHGYVRGYQLLQTRDIPYLNGAASRPLFDVQDVDMNATMLLRFLQQNCTASNGTYWLFREEGSRSLRLYDVRMLSQGKQRKWKYMMAMLCYRFASRAGRLVVAATASPTLQHRLRLRQRELLATCLELLDEIRTQPPQTSSCHHHPQYPSLSSSPKDSISAMVEEAMADTYLHGMLLATPHDAIEATASALPHLMLTSLADACMFMPVDAVPAHPRHVLLSVITSLDFFSTLATELDFGGAASSTRSYKSSNGSSKQCQSMAHARACVLEVIGDAANVLDTNDTPTAAALFHAFAVVSGVLAETEASTAAESHYAHAVQLCFKAQAKLKSAKAGPPLHAKVNGELALTYLVWAVHLAKTQDNHLGVLEKFNKALNMYVELRDRRQVAATHYQMASYYSQQQVKTKQRMEAARRHYEKALEYFGGVEVGTTFVMIHKQLAELYASSTKMEDVEHALLVVLNTFDAFKRVATLPRHEQADLESMAPTLVLRLQEYLLQLIRLGSASTKPAMQATITRFKAMYRLTIDQNTQPFAQLLLALRNMYE
ncbi:hypothetical protein DYB37_001285 [Aphanomyces astaci]|uniref:EDRF1 N-terminal domain-containing protein n=1 Tax=Aphanomyces astaci TaxID=112090 RepID=A0A3R7BHJ9_APHAT|nr:hypothetical protein DYB37_001285 [Aphanomyces astaci]